MTHPHLLHAQAAAWSLHTARSLLATRAAEEAAQIAAERAEPAGGLRAWQPRYGLARGGHGDPVGGAALLSAEPRIRVNRWATLATSTTETLQWLAGQLGAPDVGDPLHRLQAAMPAMQPGTCVTLQRWLAEADKRIRQALGLPPERDHLPGVDCPACQVRNLWVQTAGPAAAWTVVCGAGCRCIGAGCGCGMPGAVEGVAHIWPRTAVLKRSANQQTANIAA